MRIFNPADGTYIETHCDGSCYCHLMAMQFGELNQGCCSECGCPKDKVGWDYWINNRGAEVHRGHN